MSWHNCPICASINVFTVRETTECFDCRHKALEKDFVALAMTVSPSRWVEDNDPIKYEDGDDARPKWAWMGR